MFFALSTATDHSQTLAVPLLFGNYVFSVYGSTELTY